MVARAAALERDCGRTAATVAGGFAVSGFTLGSRYALPPHAHDRDGVVLTVRGRWEARAAGRQLAVQPGRVATLPAGWSHSETAGSAGALALLIEPLDDVALDGIARLLGGLELRAVPHAAPVAELLWRELGEQTDGAHALAVETLCAELVLLIQGAKRAAADRPASSASAPPWVARVVERLYDDALPASHRLSDLAADAGVSPEHLARSLRRHLACTPGDLMRRAKVVAAARELRASTLAIGRVAARCGFADQSHMTRLFRRYLGATPAEYRRRFSRPADDAPDVDVRDG